MTRWQASGWIAPLSSLVRETPEAGTPRGRLFKRRLGPAPTDSSMADHPYPPESEWCPTRNHAEAELSTSMESRGLTPLVVRATPRELDVA